MLYTTKPMPNKQMTNEQMTNEQIKTFYILLAQQNPCLPRR